MSALRAGDVISGPKIIDGLVLGTSPSGLIMDIEIEGQIVRGERTCIREHSRQTA
jgi:predicted ester cyclase